jgi:RND family efflux transporter MFP subunit
MRRTVLILTPALVALAACHGTQTDPRTEAPLVAVAALTSAASSGGRFTGVVQARVETDLAFRVAGKITARLVNAGEVVRRGQPLMRLDPADLALGAAAQTEAVAAARARAVQADADVKRLQGLVEAGAVSAQAYDHAKAAADSAQAELAAAQAQARVASNATAYAVLIADADGVVEATTGEPGQVVAQGQTVVRLAHAGPREAVLNLPETVRPALGAKATASLYGGGEASFPAHLRQLSQAADAATRTYEARYVLGGSGADAPLGATVTVALAGSAEGQGAVEAPLGAICHPGGGPGVWSIQGGRVHFHPVQILRLGIESATLTGVPAGERVVALGADRLRENQPVRTAPLAPGQIAAADQ